MGKKPTLLGQIGAQSIAFFFCVVFPGFLTAVAPSSWVKFQRNGNRVTARAQICVFFVVPYKTLTVDPVIGIGDRFHAGSETRERRSGQRDRVTKAEDEGFLVIQGEDQVAEVPVTPFNLKSVVQRSEEFLKDSQSTELKMFVVANWKFSVLFGGLMSLFTVLYVVGVVCWFFVTIYKGLRGMLRFATGADLAVESHHEESSPTETSNQD